MKTFPLCLVMAALVFFTPRSGFADVTAQQALTQAEVDYTKGDMDAAKEGFQLVLQLDPNNVAATNYLRMITTAEKNSGKGGALEKALTALVIPRVQLKSATFDTALLYLKQTAEKIDGGKTKVNFVVNIPDDVLARTKVSLDLSDVPFTEVLHYLSELTGFKFTIEKYAITVKQPTQMPAPVASGTDTPAAPDIGPQAAK